MQKVALITGASSGIGREVAIQLAQNNVELILVARNRTKLYNLAQLLNKKYKVACHVITCDMSQQNQIDQMLQLVQQLIPTVDYLINCAGYGVFKEAIHFQYDEITNMFAVNTFGMMYLTSQIASMMLNQQHGEIVFIASIAGRISTPKSSVYSATKSAIIEYANALRMELVPSHIHVTVVNPGPVATAFFERDAAMKEYYKRIEFFAIQPQYVANKIVRSLLYRSKQTITLPPILLLADKVAQLVPSISNIIIRQLFNFKEESQ